MILGIGMDLVEIERIRETYMRQKERFLMRILTDREREQFNEIVDEHRKMEWLSGRFAVKEAASKAVGSGIGSRFRFQDVEVFHDNRGKPELIVADAVKSGFPGNIHFYVTITHTHTVAGAVVIAEQEA